MSSGQKQRLTIDGFNKFSDYRFGTRLPWKARTVYSLRGKVCHVIGIYRAENFVAQGEHPLHPSVGLRPACNCLSPFKNAPVNKRKRSQLEMCIWSVDHVHISTNLMQHRTRQGCAQALWIELGCPVHPRGFVLQCRIKPKRRVHRSGHGCLG